MKKNLYDENKPLTDSFGRPLKDLRISVTDRCNFRCRYCMPEEVFPSDYTFLPKHKLLTFEEITRLAGIFASLGVQKIRITGGEPLLRKDLPSLIQMLRSVHGIQDIALTTNGSLLPKYARKLKEAGLQRVNVSLDSLDDALFSKMNGGRCNVKTVLAGIEAAAEAGLKVKVNMVVQKGINDQDIIPMARHFRGTGHILRFIEFMDVGNSNGWNLEKVVSKREIVERINTEMPLEPLKPNYIGEVASRYHYIGTKEEIGVISSVTDAFCSTCTRARLAADGHLFTCLFASEGTDMKSLLRSGADNEEIKEVIHDIWTRRRDRYSEERLFHTKKSDSKKVEMFYIGG